MKNPKYWSLLAFTTGLAVLAVSMIFLALKLRTVEPLNGTYGDQAIIAFELVDSPQALARVIGTNPPSASVVRIRLEMDQANRLDFLYMALYAIFIASSCACLAITRQRPWLLVGMVLGPLAALFDVFENLSLMALTRADADITTLLPTLHVRTFAKWELLAVTSALFAAGFIGSRRREISVAAILIALGSLTAGILMAVNPASFSPLLLNAIVSVWVWQILYAGAVVIRSNTARLA